MSSITKHIAIVNEVSILVIENSKKEVPIKPICEALDLAPNGQIEAIKSDPILRSVGKLSLSTGKDGKQYEMYCLPLKFIFGWLLKIDSRNVKEEAREALIRYQLECYEVLYDYFTSYMDFVTEKERLTDVHLDKLQTAKKNFSEAKKVMYDAEAQVRTVRADTFDDYLRRNKQMNLFD